MVQGLVSTPDDETNVRVSVPAALAGSASASVAVKTANDVTIRIMAVAPWIANRRPGQDMPNGHATQPDQRRNVFTSSAQPRRFCLTRLPPMRRRPSAFQMLRAQENSRYR